MRLMLMVLAGLCVLAASGAQARPQWTAQQADRWYAAQDWPVGSNYINAGAINQLEMWQADTFNPEQIDQELTLAEGAGMNTMRVFLHDLLWQQDAVGYKQRIDAFLVIAARHHIKPLFVLFDSCWDPNPKLGRQKEPGPGLHNSGWVQSPGQAALENAADYPRLEAYVKGVITAYRHDERILGWDLWNEPHDNVNDTMHETGKAGVVAVLLPQVFDWARSVDPDQPLTSGVFTGGDWSPEAAASPGVIERIQLTQSDIISFHNYGWPEDFEGRIRQLIKYGRPVFCTEYMARGAGSTIDGDLPVAKQYHVAMYNWGFVDGKTQTRLPWDSYQHPYTDREPAVWFHDLFHKDGTPYRQREIDLLRSLTGRGRG